jgi:hypothetical protein
MNNTRGGKREGAGRKPTGRTKVPLTIQVTPELAAELKQKAKAENKTLSCFCEEKLVK